MLNAGCNVIVHDPYVKDDGKLPSTVTLTSKLDEALKDADLIILATDHPEYAKINPKSLRAYTAIYDGRGILDQKKFGRVPIAGIGRANK